MQGRRRLAHRTPSLLAAGSAKRTPICKRSHQPFHTVRLTKDALTEALAHVGPVSTEVSLLHHHTAPPIPKSRLHNSASRDRMGNIDLWPGDDPCGAVFQITPRSVASLATLGFVPSALEVTRSEREITLATTLAYGGADDALRDGEHQETIRLCIALTQPKSEHLWFLTLWDTEIRVSVTPVNVSQVQSRDEVLPAPTATASTYTEFDSQPQSGPGMVRLLRVVMERPRESFAINDTKNVWLSIELSEKYRSTRQMALRASNRSPMEPPADNTGLPVLIASAPGPATVHPLMQAKSPISSVRSSEHHAYSRSAPSDGTHACARISPTGSSLAGSSSTDSSPTETLVESIISTKRPRQVGVDEDALQDGRAKRANTAVPRTDLLESNQPTTGSLNIDLLLPGVTGVQQVTGGSLAIVELRASYFFRIVHRHPKTTSARHELAPQLRRIQQRVQSTSTASHIAARHALASFRRVSPPALV
ncbi:uncharacterized protein TRAVEDRAFT_24684 [Trametes versicolor FP-101664 SS1]|uniref:Uncharacterized protein n=1 Tax=Trametes versicolor (strain FP-101664) TaxID=717944 RepID=R7S7H1_TRAVS|nr:uncharacterized protein TRAVEDRAFT_24684 [Trametes versicolor FP-101664 SS1]EIW51941.1 hypothetical protein TRAVEDRAFT_24684 [Trametes versicolor FP-101664 SS1]